MSHMCVHASHTRRAQDRGDEDWGTYATATKIRRVTRFPCHRGKRRRGWGQIRPDPRRNPNQETVPPRLAWVQLSPLQIPSKAAWASGGGRHAEP